MYQSCHDKVLESKTIRGWLAPTFTMLTFGKKISLSRKLAFKQRKEEEEEDWVLFLFRQKSPHALIKCRFWAWLVGGGKKIKSQAEEEEEEEADDDDVESI